jgi:pyruvate/2-oxoglutarate dehydrogenase complex dihydrolipoamide acyltransferase (E2) component
MAGPTEIVVPHSGVVEVFLLIEWLKEAGEHVVEGEEVVVIESEKATVALEAPASGTLQILVDADPDADVEVEVGATIGHILP